MRRAVQVLVVGGALLSAAACGTAKDAPSTAGPTPPAAAPTAEASTRASCEALGAVYSKSMAPYAEALTKLVNGRSAATEQQAKQSLASFATAVRGATESSADAQLRADGKQAADRLQAKAADAGFFGALKTTKDVSTAVGPTLTQWLSPVTRHCS